MMMAKHGRRVVSREDGKAAGASAHAARMPGSHTPETRTSFAAVKRTRDADHHARSRLRATMSSSPDHAHSMSVRRGPASCGRRAHGHGGTTCRRECSRRVFCSRDQIFFLDVLFRVTSRKKNIYSIGHLVRTVGFFASAHAGVENFERELQVARADRVGRANYPVKKRGFFNEDLRGDQGTLPIRRESERTLLGNKSLRFVIHAKSRMRGRFRAYFSQTAFS